MMQSPPRRSNRQKGQFAMRRPLAEEFVAYNGGVGNVQRVELNVADMVIGAAAPPSPQVDGAATALQRLLDNHSDDEDDGILDEVLRDVDVHETATTVVVRQRFAYSKLKMVAPKELFLVPEAINAYNMPNDWVLEGVISECPHLRRNGGVYVVRWKENSSNHDLPDNFQASHLRSRYPNVEVVKTQLRDANTLYLQRNPARASNG